MVINCTDCNKTVPITDTRFWKGNVYCEKCWKINIDYPDEYEDTKSESPFGYSHERKPEDA